MSYSRSHHSSLEPSPAPHQPSRRTFLKTGAAAIAGLSLAPAFSFAQAGGSANERLRYAVIGTGYEWQTRLNRSFFDKDAQSGGLTGKENSEVIALCDVSRQELAVAAKDHPKARQFADFRKMFDEMGDEIDAVVVATPDHWHYLASALSLQLGKHVFCEKPLTRTIGEARALAALADQHPELATQMGNQAHGSTNYEALRMWVEDGLLGDVTEGHFWVDTAYGRFIRRPNGIPPQEAPVPEGLDWDLWQGPAELRPYSAEVYQPKTWRGWYDFGTGNFGDQAVHVMDIGISALGLGAPYKVEVNSEDDSQLPHFIPVNGKAKLFFKNPKTGADVVFHWYENGSKDVPRPEGLPESANMSNAGFYLVGSQASAFGTGIRPSARIIPEEKRRELRPKQPDQALLKGSTYLQWLKKTRDSSVETPSDIQEGAKLTEAVLVPALAQRAGKTIVYDAANMSVPGMPELDPWITPVYHNGWKFPV